MSSMFDGTTIPLLEKIAVFTERRHEALAANVANIDTPNYHRRDLPIEAFQKALQAAIANGQTRIDPGIGVASGGDAAQSLSGASSSPFPSQLFHSLEATSPSLTFQDNNNRSVEHEMMEMTKNNLMQNFAIELMNTQFSMLQAAIREQV